VSAKGTHLIIDLYGAPAGVLNDAPFIEGIAREVAERAGAQVLEANCHQMEPQGVIVVLTLSQSHLSVHTWPEAGYAAVDLFFCAHEFHAELSLSEMLCERLRAARFEEWVLSRGVGLSGPSAVVSRHGP
jgi:S-adenosylmethionine decarboxylase